MGDAKGKEQRRLWFPPQAPVDVPDLSLLFSKEGTQIPDMGVICLESGK